MRITFLGTRGYIKIRTRIHYRHTSTLISYKKKHIMIDCGLDWTKKVWDINPDAIIITHAHPDHAWGLHAGSPAPVYATNDSWQVMHDYVIPEKLRVTVINRKPFTIGDIYIEPFDVIHSIRAPAVGYRITAGQHTIFCAHDIISINERHEALQDCILYIGDGASPVRPIIRKKYDKIFGHSSISTQMSWCQKENIPNAIFTHCGTQIVGAPALEVNALIKELAEKHAINARIAYDGMKVKI